MKGSLWRWIALAAIVVVVSILLGIRFAAVAAGK